MGLDAGGERIQAHVVSVWREPKRFFSIGGKEGMLVLTNRRLAFIYKTDAKMKWWQAVVGRQVVMFVRSKNVMNVHDGYDGSSFEADVQDERNVVLSFDDILSIDHEDRVWGSVLHMEYQKGGKTEKHQYSVVQDWVKYPAKDPTKFMRVDWGPFVKYIKDRQMVTR